MNKLRNTNKLSEDEKSTLSRFVDNSVTVTISDESTSDLVKQVQVHVHTKTCTKKGTFNEGLSYYFVDFMEMIQLLRILNTFVDIYSAIIRLFNSKSKQYHVLIPPSDFDRSAEEPKTWNSPTP